MFTDNIVTDIVLQPNVYGYSVDVSDVVGALIFQPIAADESSSIQLIEGKGESSKTTNLQSRDETEPLDINTGDDQYYFYFYIESESGRNTSWYNVTINIDHLKTPPQALTLTPVPDHVEMVIDHASASTSSVATWCGGVTRTGQVSAQCAVFDSVEWYTLSLSQPARALSMAALGDYIIVAAGEGSDGSLLTGIEIISAVDPLDIKVLSETERKRETVESSRKASNLKRSTRPTSSSSFSQEGHMHRQSVKDSFEFGRSHMASTTIGTYAVFAGGYEMRNQSEGVHLSCSIDLYKFNGISGTLYPSILSLSQCRTDIAAVSINTAGKETLMFAGGRYRDDNGAWVSSNVVDIFTFNTTDPASSTHSVHSFSEARYGIAAASTPSLLIFMGGCISGTCVDSGEASNTLDYYDIDEEEWIVTDFRDARAFMSLAVSSTHAIAYGGMKLKNATTSTFEPSAVADFLNLQTRVLSRTSDRTEKEDGLFVSHSVSGKASGQIVYFGGYTLGMEHRENEATFITDITPCITLDRCNFNGVCLELPPDEKCDCFSGFFGDRCQHIEKSLRRHVKAMASVTTFAPIFVGAMTALSSASSAVMAGTQAQSFASTQGSSFSLLPFLLYMQQFVVPLQHNDDVNELYEPFNTLALVQIGNSPSDDADSDSSAPLSMAHGLVRKIIILFVLMGLCLYLPGKIMTTCCNQFLITWGDVAFLFVLMIAPVSESVFDLDQPKSVIAVEVALLVICLWSFAICIIRPLLTREVRAYLFPGMGWSAFNVTDRALEDRNKSITDSLTTRNMASWWKNTKRKLREVKWQLSVKSPSNGKGTGAEGELHGPGRYAKKTYREWRVMGSQHSVNLEDLKKPVEYQTGDEMDSWQAFQFRNFMEPVQYYGNETRFKSCCGPLHFFRCLFSQWWLFVEYSYLIIYVGVAVWMDGPGQFMVLFYIGCAYLFLVFIIMPYRPEFLAQTTLTIVMLQIQLVLFHFILKDRARVDLLLYIVVLQLLCLPLRMAVASFYSTTRYMQEHYILTRERELGRPLPDPTPRSGQSSSRMNLGTRVGRSSSRAEGVEDDFSSIRSGKKKKSRSNLKRDKGRTTTFMSGAF